MRPRWLRLLAACLAVAILVTASAPAEAVIIGPDPGGGGGGGGGRGGGGGGGGGRGGGKGGKKCPPPPPSPRRPEHQVAGCWYIVKTTYEEVPYGSLRREQLEGVFTTGKYDWASDETSRLSVEYDPGYPRNEDRHDPGADKVVGYKRTRTTESANYVLDWYRPRIRQYFDRWRLEHGRLYVKRLIWSPIVEWPRKRTDWWNDGVRAEYFVGSGQFDTAWDFGVGWGNIYYPGGAWIEFPRPDPRSPRSPLVKAPPVYDTVGGTKPPILSPPEDWLGDELVKKHASSKEVLGDERYFHFGGEPYNDPASGKRGSNAILAVKTSVTGFPGGQQRVTAVSARVLGNYPWKGRLYFGLREGSDPKGEAMWVGLLPIPEFTTLGRYQVEVTIEGKNAWGDSRKKIIYMTLIVDAGDRSTHETNPGDTGFCGMTEDEIRKTPNWWWRCSDPRLVK